ncbi:hypothetical protein [Pseudokineococcus sp. 1T1Z-3]|uniref:hypothetical protein n=1 Tax=Pseudokineococcus sp. 1T1Z-3 TaxID=3132745 RepID=UPI0030A2B093
MDRQAARELKRELLATSSPLRAAAREDAVGAGGAVVVGVRVFGEGRYGVAVRHSGGVGADVGARARDLAGDDADVLDIGEVRALSSAAPQRVGAPGEERPAPSGPPSGRATPQEPGRWAAPVLQQRERPLRPGLSVAQEAVTAGTLGALVRRRADGRTYALSNNHVLGDSDRAAEGSPVLQPGPADGGTAADVVGALGPVVPLQVATPNVVDAALAALADDVEVDPTYPVGAVTGTAVADDELVVEKVGRTTGLTRGVVTAVELDGVAVSFPAGVLTFDDQVEVAGLDGAFSAGGDSGSLVYDPATARAVGLLFAGSQRGGPGGTGLTFCNPVDAVLAALEVELLG